MLSKYYCIEQGEAVFDETYGSHFMSAIEDALREKYQDAGIKRIIPVGKGTLGSFFELCVNGKRKFVKTHRCGDRYRLNLLKEIEIMSLVYGSMIDIEKVEFETEGIQAVCMVMDFLYPCLDSVRPEEVRKQIAFYRKSLGQVELTSGYSFSQVLDAGERSLDCLRAEGLLSKDIFVRCRESLQRIREGMPCERFICHGDLSNVNIMYADGCGGKIPIVIDWEDALLAFEGYDFLYWLTFFSQRKFYSSSLLAEQGIDKNWGIDIMALIVAVKSYMSYRNGSYVKNRFSFDRRLYEIYDMGK